MLVNHAANDPLNHAQGQRVSGVTELVLPNRNELSMVLPSLSFLTNQISDRWLTWISLGHGTDKEQLRFYGFNLNRVRIIQPRSDEHAFWLFWEALTEGNSHTVVSSLSHSTEKQIRLLEKAAIKGRCVGLVLRERGAIHH